MGCKSPRNARRPDAGRGLLRAALSIALVLGLGLEAVPARGAELPAHERRLLDGLRERRLFAVAEAYCQQQLAQPQRSAAERAAFTVERMRLLGEQALEAPAEERTRWWTAAHAVADAWRGEQSASSHTLLIEAQAALLRVWEGELLRQQAEVARGTQPDYAPALEALRRAESALESVSQRVEQSLLTQRAAAEPDELTRDELFSLRNHLQLELARLLIARGRCYPAGSNDQLAAATQAVELLHGIQAQLPADDPLVWETYVEELVCQRLLASRSEQQRVLALLNASPPPPTLALRIRAEKIRTALAFGEHEQAQNLSQDAVPPRTPGAADLDLARFEALLARWQALAQAGREAETQTARQRALELAREMERVHGSYWGRRADALLVRSSGGSGEHADLEILRRRADDHYLRGDYAAAVEAYDTVAEAARAAGATDDEFLAGYRAALVLQKQGADAESLARLRSLGRSLPDHGEAPAAHFEAIKAAARLARAEPMQMATYVELLSEHVATWPAAGTTATARLWLGQYFRFQQQWAEAVAAYAAIPPTSPEADEAVAGLTAAWAARLAESKDSPDVALEWMEQSRAALGVFAAAPQAAPAVRLRAAIACARLALQHAPRQLPLIAPQLDELLALSADDADAAALRAEAQAWRTVCAALDPRGPADASTLNQALADATDAQLRDVATLLAAFLPTASEPQLRRRAGQLQLVLLDRIDPQQTTRRLVRWRADALAATGARAEALERYQTLIAAQPRDAELQVAYAELLAAGTAPEDQRAALSQWRTIAQRTKPQSDTWYRAKLGVAATLLRLGDPASRREAEELIRWMQAATPLASTPWQARFDELR